MLDEWGRHTLRSLVPRRHLTVTGTPPDTRAMPETHLPPSHNICSFTSPASMMVLPCTMRKVKLGRLHTPAHKLRVVHQACAKLTFIAGYNRRRASTIQIYFVVPASWKLPRANKCAFFVTVCNG